jgi:SAM-dependent methyltransferase
MLPARHLELNGTVCASWPTAARSTTTECADSYPESVIETGASERVRLLFNRRANGWGRKYRRWGKLLWRLDAFCTVARERVQPPAEVLDFGCGTGHLAARLNTNGYQVTGCDFAEDMIARARTIFYGKAIQWVPLPAGWRRLPFVEGAFAAVVSSAVFEYITDVDLVVSELARVLKDDGVLIFSVPNPESFRRRREAWWLRVARRRWVRSAVCVLPRMQRYFEYLDLSTNRFPLPQWQATVEAHGFRRFEHVGQRQKKPSQFMFAFKKVRCSPAVIGTERTRCTQ